MNPTCPRRSTARRSTSLLHRLALATATIFGGSLLAALPGCGSGAPPAPPAVTAPPPAVAGQGATTPPPSAPLAAIAAAGSSNHTVYAAKGMACEQCHPCGKRVAGGHAVAWMDTTSPSFHAVAANDGLAACASCHGANLDGVGGTTTVACAQCHGAAWRTTCTQCHGGVDSQTGAPPRTTWGNTADAVRVGAHTAHLGATHGLAAAVACSACHVVPTDALSSGHVVVGTASVTFSGLASGGVAAAPAWTRATATCSNTYCHGGKYAGNATAAGTATAPRWTDTTAVAGACGSCHKAPPSSASHASVTTTTNCGSCHTGYSCTTANLAACTVNKATHLNGTVDAANLTCTTCHGSATNAAPPAATSAANSAVKIGAHQAHLVKANLRPAAVACAECHTVPTSTSHASGTVDLTWSGIAVTGGVVPTPASLTAAAQATWEASPTCTNYCHGGKYAGNATYAGSATAPRWTDTAAAASACGSCHKAPPSSASHAGVTATTNCGSCHTGYSCTTANLAACTVNKATHLNGTVDAPSLSCNSCHGSATNNAPPAATSTVNAAVKVGAHQAHLTKANLKTAAVTCAECHTVPTSTSHASGTVEMAWSGLAVTGGIVPTPASLAAAAQATWEATPTCTNYCHGAKWIGNATYAGSATAVSWTATAATATTCGSCHKAPPSSASHAGVTTTTNCGSCHTGYSCTTANLAACTVNKATHLNGAVDAANLTCTTCHGNKAQTATAASPLYAAPPIDTAGLATGGFRIGAHQKHLTSTTYRSAAIPCAWCHASVGSYASNHADGTRQVAFTGATPAALQAGTWTASTATAAGTCSNTGCHTVNSRSGQTDNGTLRTPTWTGTITACTACHSVTMSTLSRRHASVGSHASVACSTCHGTGYSATAVNKATHLDGVRTIVTVASGTGIRTWNATTGTCTASCHGSQTW